MPENTPKNEPENEQKKGRPPKPKSEKRDQIIKVYVTQEEKEIIEVNGALAGFPASTFLRKLGLNKHIKPKEDSAILKEVRAELGRISGLINQIAKKVNQGKVQDLTKTDWKKAKKWLIDTLRKLDL